MAFGCWSPEVADGDGVVIVRWLTDRRATNFRSDAHAQEHKLEGSSSTWSEGTGYLAFPLRTPSEDLQLGEQANDTRILSTDRQPGDSSFSTAVVGWIETTRHYKEITPNWPLDDSLLHRHLSTVLLAQYDYWWNSLVSPYGRLRRATLLPGRRHVGQLWRPGCLGRETPLQGLGLQGLRSKKDVARNEILLKSLPSNLRQ
ncbi:hypothetical protein MRX96_005897 [Rhipicephalus microplus]